MRRLLTAGLGALVLSCQGPAAVLAHTERHPMAGTNRDGVGAQPDVAVPADRALDEALRRVSWFPHTPGLNA